MRSGSAQLNQSCSPSTSIRRAPLIRSATIRRLVSRCGAMEHQRRRPHRGQHVADVAFHRHAVERDRLRGARAAPLVPDEPLEPVLVLSTGRAQPVRTFDEVSAVAPAVSDLAQLAAPLLVVRRPRIVRRPEAARRRVVEDEGARPLRIRGREQERDPRAFLRRPEHRALGIDGVHDGADVVHPRLERRHLANRVREAAPALVEQEDAGVPGEILDVVDEQRHVPAGQQVGERAADEHEVDRSVPHDLVGDRHVAAPGVADVRHVHGRILPSWRLLRPSGNS